MGRYLGRALRGAGKALEKGIESADALIDGPVTDGIRQATDTGKQAINKVSSNITDRTSSESTNNFLSKDGDNESVTAFPVKDDDKIPTASPSPYPVDGKFIGGSVSKKKLDEMLSRGVLIRGETLQAAIWGSIESNRTPLGGARSKHMEIGLATKAAGMDKRSGLLGLTNHRVIFYMPKMMNRYEFEAYKIKQIDSVQFTKGMRKGRIDIGTANDNPHHKRRRQ